MNLVGFQLSNSGDFKSEKRILKDCSDYIEQKFRDNKRAEILPGKIQEILNSLSRIKTIVEKNPNATDILNAIDNLESTCDAAMSLYPEPQNRKFYFNHLKGLSPELKRVIRLLDRYK